MRNTYDATISSMRKKHDEVMKSMGGKKTAAPKPEAKAKYWTISTMPVRSVGETMAGYEGGPVPRFENTSYHTVSKDLKTIRYSHSFQWPEKRNKKGVKTLNPFREKTKK